MLSNRVSGASLVAIVVLISSACLASLVQAQPPSAGAGPDEGEELAALGDGVGPSHCLGTGDARWVMGQALFVQLEPFGAELATEGGLCIPLIREPGELFAYTRFEAGLESLATFGYLHLGPYLELVPVSLLELRTGLQGVYYFPAGFDLTGYHPQTDSAFDNTSFPADAATAELGWLWYGRATLLLDVPLAGRIGVFLFDELSVEYWSLGDGPLFYHSRWDLMVPSNGALIRNHAALFLTLRANESLRVQVGPSHQIRFVPSTGYTAHLLGGTAALYWDRVSATFADLLVYLELAGFASHEFRTGLYALAGVSVAYDLGKL